MPSSITPNMSLVVPTVDKQAGPQYATDINGDLSIIDNHNHTTGLGAPIPVAAINYNADLSAMNNRLKLAKSLTFSPQSSPLNGITPDIGALYASGVDLYFNDGNGNQIRITQAGSLAGTPGSISNLTPPASVNFNSGTGEFVFQQAVNTPASLDAGSVTIRDETAGGNGITLNAPSSLGADASLTLPIPPGSTELLQIDSSGNITPSTTFTQASVPTGSMIAFAGPNSSIPAGFLYCNGQAVSRTTYSNLFSVMGTGWGIGDGSTTFNVPFTSGLFLRGQDDGTGNDPAASARTAIPASGGNSGDNVGSFQESAISDHNHNEVVSAASGSGVGVQTVPAATGPLANSNVQTNGAQIISGASEVSIESRPINVYVVYIIKT